MYIQLLHISLSIFDCIYFNCLNRTRRFLKKKDMKKKDKKRGGIDMKEKERTGKGREETEERKRTKGDRGTEIVVCVGATRRKAFQIRGLV
jgi:hypothetical protein